MSDLGPEPTSTGKGKSSCGKASGRKTASTGVVGKGNKRKRGEASDDGDDDDSEGDGDSMSEDGSHTSDLNYRPDKRARTVTGRKAGNVGDDVGEDEGMALRSGTRLSRAS